MTFTTSLLGFHFCKIWILCSWNFFSPCTPFNADQGGFFLSRRREVVRSGFTHRWLLEARNVLRRIINWSIVVRGGRLVCCQFQRNPHSPEGGCFRFASPWCAHGIFTMPYVMTQPWKEERFFSAGRSAHRTVSRLDRKVGTPLCVCMRYSIGRQRGHNVPKRRYVYRVISRAGYNMDEVIFFIAAVVMVA